MIKRSVAVLALILITAGLSLADVVYQCRSSQGESLEVAKVETPYSPFLKVKTSRMEMQGFAVVLTFSDGLIRYSLAGSSNHFFSIDERGQEVTAYWSLSRAGLFTCLIGESNPS